MSEPRIWTILDLLNWTTEFFQTHGIDSPRLDAELLLCDVLALERVQLYTRFDRPLDPQELARFRRRVVRRARDREPVAYILGTREFWSLELVVGPDVLVPRPETERLVEIALALVRQRFGEKENGLTIVDVGTGSGAIAIAMATELPSAQVWALDISAGALEVARRNVASHGLDERVHCVESDLLQHLPEQVLPVDIIVSNPPYLADRELAEVAPEIHHEPRIALVAGSDGLEVVTNLARQALTALASDGVFVCEIGATQGEAGAAALRRAGFRHVEVEADYAGLDRVLVASRRVPASSHANTAEDRGATQAVGPTE